MQIAAASPAVMAATPNAALQTQAQTALAQLAEDFAVLEDSDPVSAFEVARTPMRRRGGTLRQGNFEYPSFRQSRIAAAVCVAMSTNNTRRVERVILSPRKTITHMLDANSAGRERLRPQAASKKTMAVINPLYDFASEEKAPPSFPISGSLRPRRLGRAQRWAIRDRPLQRRTMTSCRPHGHGLAIRGERY
ncbi:hypothetical protein N8I77_005516 [Diaporthe amygdali]|uniref:Uncharacterized protein n=1 Tax=Phomopsis amygdali TaxID=1214568 RepID=A0AAD9W3G6_PHOAM|nr:hypothetical protein N8I77_005516 [Diaporthe amygdali]